MSETAGYSGLLSPGDTYIDGDGTAKIAKQPDLIVGGVLYPEGGGGRYPANQGPPGVISVAFDMNEYKPRFPGDPWTRGHGASAICTPGDLISSAEHKKIVPGCASVGTYGGVRPFNFVNPPWYTLLGVKAMSVSANCLEAFDAEYGPHQWSLHILVRFPVLQCNIAVTSTGVLLVDPQFAYAGRIAQQIPPGIFTLTPLDLWGFFLFWLEAPGVTPPPVEHLYLYHETKVATTLNPAHGTEVFRGSHVNISATPYPFHTLQSFSIRGSVRKEDGTIEEITKNVDITDPYGTTTFKWDLDDYSIAQWLLDSGIGSIQSDIYVSGVSTYTGTKPIKAGKPVSIQCETNECCAPSWSITDQDAGTLDWGLSIDSDGLITGFIPRDEELGVYGIEVTVTGPTQSTSAWVYVEVGEPDIYGTVWVGTALLAGKTISGLIEVGDLVYASTIDGAPGNGHIYVANKSDLTSWTECGYSTTVPGIVALARLTDEILAAMDYNGRLWVCLDGNMWTRTSTTYQGVGGAGDLLDNLIPINSSMCLWYNQSGSLGGHGIYVIDVIGDSVVSSGNVGSQGLVTTAKEMAYGNGVVLAVATGNSGGHKVLRFTVNTTTGALAGPTTALDLEPTHGSDGEAGVCYKHGKFCVINNKKVFTSTDGGVTWVTSAEEAPIETARMYPLSPRTPNIAYMAINTSADFYRTIDSFANEAMVLDGTGSGLSRAIMLELADGTLIAGDSNLTTNIWVSTE